ncbi:MAG: hypothetical protein M3Q69_06115, partial [Acidobacteriota bacterium]|nr:hypothetical protein [Acidobacteriota bacterium]
VQMIAYVVVAAGWAALLTWRGDALVMWLRSFTPGGMMHSVANAESLSMSLFGVMFALASMTVLLALHTILAED